VQIIFCDIGHHIPFNQTTSKETMSKYSEAGVDIDKGNEFVSRIKKMVGETHGRGVIGDIGGFSGLYAIGNAGYEDPVLISSTDGVGTKLMVAKLCNKHDTIGIDLVAMCVNDVVVSGAKPLFFLDYFAVSKLDLCVATDVVKGIKEGCKQAECALIGGETAEMPGLYRSGDYDLAGFVVGMVERNKIIDGSDIRVSDKIIGLASSGIHANGYSLVRKIFFDELGLSVDDHIEELGCTVGEELLRPTKIYVKSILTTLRNHTISGLIHNTGGGFIDNIPRILPKNTKAALHKGSWSIPPVFSYLQKKGNIPEKEMLRTFNMGIGMMAVVHEEETDDILQQFKALGETPFIIGEIKIAGQEKDEERVVFE
jgi:phosphoribosylformylglycinamidine cyclo-ligase